MLRKLDRATLAYLGAVVVAALCAYWFLSVYFRVYYRPDPALPVYALESGWEYQTRHTPRKELGALGGVNPREVGAGETLTLYRRLNTRVQGASLMVRTKHQTLRVLLDGQPLYESDRTGPGQDPGVGLHIIPLPEEYLGGELALELSSPYGAYAGRVSSILLGPVPALEAALFASALRPVLFMAVSLFLGFCTIGLAFAQGLQGVRQWKYLAIGVFAVDWGVYYMCNENIALHFFTPMQASMFSLGCYYFMQVPLAIFFFCSMRRHRKAMLPSVCLHSLFFAAALLLQATGFADLPRLVHINNALMGAGLLYIVVLCLLEIGRGNRYLWVSTPFLFVAWGATVLDYGFFYLTRMQMRYLFLDAYFLLILAVLAHSLWQFFRQYYRERRDVEVLTLQSKLALESYELEREHNLRFRELKHEFNKHMGAIRLYLDYGKEEEASRYLERVSERYGELKLTAHSDHLLVNALLGRLLRTARQEGVRVELHVEEIGSLSMEDDELFSLLSNLIDNALEACRAVPQGGRYIRLSIRRREPYLHISCENSRRGRLLSGEEGLRSTKPDPENHGYGLRNIRRIVQNHDGMLDISPTDSTFKITLAVKAAGQAAAVRNA